MSDRVLAFGPFALHPDRRLLLEDGKSVRVGSRALEILIALAERAGELLTKEDLIARAWPDTVVEEASLRVHVAALRKALGDGQPGRRFIVNVPGRGYSFVATTEGTVAAAETAAPASGLPALLTRLVGRQQAVDDLLGHLRTRRLVTIAGPGGIGKTSVALAVAEAAASRFAEGAVFVDLAPVDDPRGVPAALAAALGVAVRTEPYLDSLVATIRTRRVLLLLDNCEHVVDAAATLAEAVLRGVPGASILATSREPLRAAGEWVQRLPPLGLPPVAPALTAEEALRSPAVQLFVERAAGALGGFELTDAQAPLVAEICRRLDGIALAIELAAGRMDAFGLSELARLLDDRFRLLMRGRRTALPRQQTLRATLDWSYGALSAEEQAILRQLAVFPGGFSLDAARAVAVVPGLRGPAFDDLLACLVAKSLLTVEIEEAGVGYRLMETTRGYLRERLAESGEAPAVAQRHACFHRDLFEAAARAWETQAGAAWLGLYARRIDDLRTALGWAFAPDGDATIGVALVVAAVPLWFQLSLVDECLAWVERALATLPADAAGDERRHMQLHAALGWAQMYAMTRLDGSAAAWRRTLDLAETLGDRDYQLRALWALWADRTNHGEFRAALDLAGRFRHVADGTDLLIADRMTGASLHFLGEQARARAHIDRMLAQYAPPPERSHAVRFQFDQRATARITLARILWLQGQEQDALREAADSVEQARALGHTLSLCNVIAQSACPVALLAGNLDAAARYLGLLREHTSADALDVWRAYADGFEGELLCRTGRVAQGLPLLTGAVAMLRQAGFTQYLTAFLASLGRIVVAEGQPGAGLSAVDEALGRCAATGESWCLPELLRIRAEGLLAAGAPDAPMAAAAELSRAHAMATAQGAVAWRDRIVLSLQHMGLG